MVTIGAAAADIIAAVASAMGLIATELVLTNAAAAVAGGDTAVIDATPTSVVYNTGAVSIPLNWEPATIQSLVDTQSIGSFDAPTGS